MPLKITILEGPGAGKVFEFGDEVEVVEIGRDPDHCQVLFPPDFTVVGRRHLGIRRALGGYELELKLQNPVLIDGREPFDDEDLGPVQEVRVGRDGPRLRIETSLEGDLPSTDDAVPMSAPSTLAQTQRRSTQRVALAVLAIAIVAATAWALLYWQQSRIDRELSALLVRTGESVASLSPDMLKRVSASTYLVVMRDGQGGEDPIGTAWVAANGVLATNAHIAEIFGSLKPRWSLTVRGTTPPYATIPIQRVVIHPDYQRFTDAWQAFQPARSGIDDSLTSVESPGAGYDVGLMYVAPGVALAPPLEVADDVTLAKLTAGRAVAFAGFPMELLAGGGVNPKAPVPQVQVGHVTAVTDYFLLPGDPLERNLVQHQLPATGGASGSPVVDSSGQVVAVLSGGNIVMLNKTLRVPLGAGVNFAQRSSLVRELLENRVDTVAPLRRAAWKSGFGTFENPVEKVPQLLLRQWQDRVGSGRQPIEVIRSRGALAREGGQEEFHTKWFRGIISQPGRYLAVAVSPRRYNISIAMYQSRTLILRNSESETWFPVIDCEFSGGQAVDVAVFARNQKENPDYELSIWFLPY